MFSELRGFNADDGLLARACNMTDGTNGAAIDAITPIASKLKEIPGKHLMMQLLQPPSPVFARF